MTTQVSFKSKSGESVSGELAEPKAPGKVPCVVLIQEYWGINAHIKDLVERMAKEGFLVVAPDLYHGKIATDAEAAGALMTALDTGKAAGEIAGAVAFLKEHPRSNGKVAVMGFCMGGAMALASACFVDGLAAVASFYGVPPADKVDYKKVTAPVIAHVAKHDDWVTIAKVDEVKKQLEANGKTMEVNVYDASHAFVNDTRPEVYHPSNAKLAWERTVKFFQKHLA